ncbi:hypothetical protein N2152v2_009689 [Parachlorella kessleri]
MGSRAWAGGPNTRFGLNYGFPYCLTIAKGGNDNRPYQRLPGIGPPFANPEMNAGMANLTCTRQPSPNFVPSIQALGPHVAALGMRFYQGTKGANFPPKYYNSIFVAQHGSGGRDIPIGYRVMRVVLDKTATKVVSYEPFATGWLVNEGQAPPAAYFTGRPVDVQQLRDGSLLISDDFASVLYRVTYQAPA